MNKKEFQEIVCGDLCTVRTGIQTTDLGVIINKEIAIKNDSLAVIMHDGDQFIQKGVMVKYWKEQKNIAIPEPKYVVKIVHILGMSQGFWYPDSMVVKIFPNKKARGHVKWYFKKGVSIS